MKPTTNSLRVAYLALTGVALLACGRAAEKTEKAADATKAAAKAVVKTVEELEAGKDGKLPAVGSTVDVKTATYTNAIGSPELIGTWTDPKFDPKQYAVYYVRVLEIPTPHWMDHLRRRPEQPGAAEGRPGHGSGAGLDVIAAAPAARRECWL